jgi:hypothetical protein
MGQAIFALLDARHQLELPLYALHCTADHITPYKVRRAQHPTWHSHGAGLLQQHLSRAGPVHPGKR